MSQSVSPAEHAVDALRSLRRDVAHARRSLWRERGFAFICIVSLGIGMGAVVALATFSRAILSPARGIDTTNVTELLVLPLGPLRAKAGEWAIEQWSYPDFRVLRDSDVGMTVAGWTRDESDFGAPTPEEATPPRVTTIYVTSNYFNVFGVPLARGAGFDPAIDDATSAEPRVVLSDTLWRNRLNADPDIVGKSVTIGGVLHTVVGVAPEDFRGHFHFFQAPGSMVFIPLERHPRLKDNPNLRDDRTADWIHMHGRLQNGVDIKQANALVSTIVANLAREYPATNAFKQATVEWYTAMGAAGRPEQTRIFSVLFSLAGAVLLIVCLNISGMMLVRGATREREMSIRAAIGADRRRLIQHLFLEAVMLAVAGGAIAGFVLFAIPAAGAWYLGVTVPQEVDFDLTGLAIASGLCFTVSVLFGMMPALRFSKPDLVPALKEDSGGGGRHTIRVHRFAAMAQIGIAVPFLVISGVMIDRVRTADYGFDMDGLAGARVPAPSGDARDAAFKVMRARDNLRQTTGVRAVAMAEGMPIDFDYRLFRVGRPGGADFATAHVTRVAEDFLDAVGAPLLRGRTITAEDRKMAAPVAVISEPLAKALFAGEEAIGQKVAITQSDSRVQEYEVVGVSADFATSQLTTERPQLLLPLPETLPPTMYLIARGAPGAEPQLKSALETALRELGVEAQPGVAFQGIVSGADLAEKSEQDLVSEGTAVGVAGGLVLILAALGIIGVVRFMVMTRRRELAVRMALGSTRLRLFGMLLSDIVRLVVPGVAGGLLLAFVLIRTMDNVMGTPLTLGPEPLGVMEPVIYAIASVIAITVALLAGLPSARRATTVPPMAAIRSE